MNAASARTLIASARGIALALICAISLLNFLDRMILAAVMPAIKAEFVLTDSRPGLFSTMFGVVYAIAGLPLGRQRIACRAAG